MKIKISQSQFNSLIKEQEDNYEKVLSDLEYATDKPFSCVQYEPITINGEKSFPKNYLKSVQHIISSITGEKKQSVNLTFFRDWNGQVGSSVVVLKIGGEDKGKRFQQIEYTGTFHCTGRDIVIDLEGAQYYQAKEDGSTKDEDLVKLATAFTPNPFSSTIPLKEYNSLKDLGKEIEKIKFDFSKLNAIV